MLDLELEMSRLTEGAADAEARAAAVEVGRQGAFHPLPPLTPGLVHPSGLGRQRQGPAAEAQCGL